jgi:transposase-like protein
LMSREGSFGTAVLWPAADSPRSDGVLLSPRLAAVVAEAMSDEFSMTILSSSVSQGKTVVEICNEEGIPQSTCYKRVRHLVDEGAMVVERIVVASTGRKYSVYRSAFSRLEVRLENGVISAKGTLNPAAAEKARWTSRVPESPHPLPRETVATRHGSRRRSRIRGGRS